VRNRQPTPQERERIKQMLHDPVLREYFQRLATTFRRDLKTADSMHVVGVAQGALEVLEDHILNLE